MRIRLIGLTAIVMVAAVLPAAPAAAKTIKPEIHAFVVTNSLPGQDGDFAAGALVESKSKKCNRGRTIEFFHKGKSFGKAKTDKNGEAYRKTGDSSLQSGKYEAKMKKKGDCKADNTSGTVSSNGTFTPKD